MRATGIVRRIDDLGRVVIPREIRRTMNISEGEPLEIFTDKGMVIFKKYKAYEVNYELMFQVTAAMFDIAGIYNEKGELVRVGANYTLDTRIIANPKGVTEHNNVLIIPIEDDGGDLVALIAAGVNTDEEVEAIRRLALATLTTNE